MLHAVSVPVDVWLWLSVVLLIFCLYSKASTSWNYCFLKFFLLGTLEAVAFGVLFLLYRFLPCDFCALFFLGTVLGSATTAVALPSCRSSSLCWVRPSWCRDHVIQVSTILASHFLTRTLFLKLFLFIFKMPLCLAVQVYCRFVGVFVLQVKVRVAMKAAMSRLWTGLWLTRLRSRRNCLFHWQSSCLKRTNVAPKHSNSLQLLCVVFDVIMLSSPGTGLLIGPRWMKMNGRKMYGCFSSYNCSCRNE